MPRESTSTSSGAEEPCVQWLILFSFLLIPAYSSGEMSVSLDEMAQMPCPFQLFEVQGDFLHIQFPDPVDLVVSLNRFETPYYASMW